MHLSTIILGPVVTEKAEALKTQRVYTLRVNLGATKIDLQNALRKYYDVEVEGIRVLRTTPKVRLLGQGKTLEKRHRSKHMMVTLSKDSKPLDLSQFRVL
jgi:ribosomal protein L23